MFEPEAKRGGRVEEDDFGTGKSGGGDLEVGVILPRVFSSSNEGVNGFEVGAIFPPWFSSSNEGVDNLFFACSRTVVVLEPLFCPINVSFHSLFIAACLGRTTRVIRPIPSV